MRRFHCGLMVILLLVAVSAAPVWSETYFMYSQYGGTWLDANKTADPDDNLMCWAAAASNVMSWGKWGAAGYSTETAIFQYFVDHWTNKGGYMYWAYNWWLNGTPPPTTAYAYPDVPGGNFFPNHPASNYVVNAYSGNLMSAADSLLHKGAGVTMTIRTASGGAHAVTLWGFSYSAPGAYTSVFITDSDDGYYGLREYPLVYQNNLWYLGGGYSGWYISDLETLAMYSEATTSSPSPTTSTQPVKKPKGKPAKGEDLEAVVPLSPSWVFLGTGVLSLYFLRRRRPGKGNS